MKFEVRVSSWNGYDGGTHEEPKPSKELLRHLAGGESARAVKILDATSQERKTLDGHVESQADSEKAYAKAQEDGTWHEGNLQQFVVDARARLASGDVDAQTRSFLLAGLADAHDRLGDTAAAAKAREELNGA